MDPVALWDGFIAQASPGQLVALGGGLAIALAMLLRGSGKQRRGGDDEVQTGPSLPVRVHCRANESLYSLYFLCYVHRMTL